MNHTFTKSIVVLFTLALTQLAQLFGQSVNVLYPNGGEVLPVNATVQITWNQTFLNNIRIEYSTNNGSSWTDIINSYPASAGEFLWTVPNQITTQGKIRLTDLVNTLITDVSDQVFYIQDNSTNKYGGGSFDGYASGFNIANAVILASFNDGGSYPIGSVQDITWATLNSDFVDIEWSSDNGSSWNSIATGIQANLNLYSWQIPNVFGTQNVIRVKDTFNPNQFFASSAQSFTILSDDPAKFRGGNGDGSDFDINLNNDLLLLYPAGGENLPENSTIQIVWAANLTANVVLDYSTNNGANWLSLGSPQPGNTGTFNWQLPLGYNNQMLVRVADAANQNVNLDISSPFTILSQVTNKYFGGGYDGAAVNENQPAQIQVLSPNGGEIIYANNVIQIQWSSVNVDYVSLEYSTNTGSTWQSIATGVPSVLQTYTWTVPAIAAESSALIRITDDFNTVIKDTSDAVFTIPHQATVKHNGGNFDGYASAINVSNALSVIVPNGGEEWVEGVFHRIEWTANNFDNVRIEYSTNNGSNWILISASHPANTGFFNWQVPSTATLQARVRVLDVLNQLNINDISDQVFAIHTLAPQKYFGGEADGADVNVNQPPSITVTAPVGGEFWFEGQQVQITWTNVNVNTVNIDISSNNGSTWTQIGAGQPAVLGQFTWTVTGFAAQNSVRVRVSDSSNPGTFGMSTAGHTIPFYSASKNLGGSADGHAMNVNQANRLLVVSPNGGERFAENSLQQIQWVANDIGNVRLEYSTNNGTNWILVNANQPGNLGLFSWLMPMNPTTQARVRISDILNQSTVFDISDNTFVIAGETPEKHHGGSFDGFSVGINQPTSITVLAPNGGEVWYEEQTVNITWNSVNVTDVDIQISTNNGSSWTTIASNQPGVLGSYVWTVTGIYGPQSLVRILDSSDPSIKDSSDAIFDIPLFFPVKFTGGGFDGYAKDVNANQALQVLSPNGGETYAVGSTQQIFWNANDISNVRLEYTTNNGSSWTMISANEAGNRGVYQWVVPPTVGALARVRVLDVLNQFNVFDISDNTFVIQDVNTDKYLGGEGDGHDMSDNTQFSVSVLSPNGGEVWYEGQNVTITWTSVNINSVAIEISSNNGSTWNVLDPDEPAVVSSFSWQVSGNYGFNTNLVRVRSTDQPTVMDTSNAVFSIPQFLGNKHNGGSFDGFASNINDANAIQLLNPNGGEIFAENSVQQIRWNANNITNIRIEYSTNNGSNWILISANELANAGVYNWTVPAIAPANQVRVRVADVLNQFSRFDISDAAFSIEAILAEKYQGGSGDGHDMNVNQPPSITVISPNGGEVWYESQTVNISWSSVNVTTLNVELSSNNGSSWTTLATGIPAVTGSFQWVVTGFYSQNANLVRLTSATHVGVQDISNSAFSIPMFLGSKHGGGSFDGFASDINDANSIQLLSPNGGQVFAEGSIQQIQWNANNITNIRIEYSTNNGSVWTLISANELANSGVFNWTVPNTQTQQARIRVADVLNQFSRFDVSDSVFQIQPVLAEKYHGGGFDGHAMNVNQPPAITVLSPNGGEVWYEGQQVSITWNSVNVVDVEIEISSNNGSSWSVISPSEQAVFGSYTWTVSGFYAQNANLIRLKSVQIPSVLDVSDLPFSIPVFVQNKTYGGSFDGYASGINDANAIQLLFPNGGEVFAEGSVQQILWNANNINNIRIEFSTDNGSNWNLISANVLANTGAFNWTVPVVFTQQARIRIADVLNQFSRFDISDNAFQIQPVLLAKYAGGSFDGHAMNVNQPPTITVLTPNGGETWYEGQPMHITWSSVNITSVAIDISSNNGSTWTTIHTGEPAVIGNYFWIVNGFAANGTARIRVRDESDPTVKDSSDTGFTIPLFASNKHVGGSFDGYAFDINANNAIQLLSPSGGEVFAEASVQQIRWNANNITNVRLDYSTNNGSTWNLISANEPANAIAYNWVVPQVFTQQGKIRIADVLNQSTVFSVSNGVFSIQSPIVEKYHGGSYDGHVMNMNQPPTVTVLSPNGGETFYEGQTMPITWNQVNLTTVTIEISSNNGSSWNVIQPSLQAVLGSFNWTVSGMAGNGTVLVRIKDENNPLVFDNSDTGFTIPLFVQAKSFGGAYDGYAGDINNAQAIQLNQPNGGEIFAEGSVQQIVWSANNIANVRLEYSTNNGSNWILISASEPGNSIAYNWTIPQANTFAARVRVSDVLNQSTRFDISDAVFAIQSVNPAKYLGGSFDGHVMSVSQPPSIAVITPNGNELWYEGQQVQVTWSSVNVTDVNIEISSNNGSSWSVIGQAIPSVLGSYSWTVNGFTANGTALIRVLDSGNPTVADTSDLTFTIPLFLASKHYGGQFDGFASDVNQQNLLQVIYPNGGETFAEQTTQNIQWVANGVSNVRLEYSTNNGSSWVLITASTGAHAGVFAWTLPSLTTLNALVRVSDIQNPNVIFAQSAQVFSIQGSAPEKYRGGAYDGFAMGTTGGGLITVTAPNGGQNWIGASTQNITWTSSNVGFVDIEFSTDNGSTWNLIAGSVSASLLSYAWTIPDAVGSAVSLIKITDSNDPVVSDQSDAVFNIQLFYSQKYQGGHFDGHSRDKFPGGTITLTAPNTVVTLIPGALTNITWNFTNLSDLQLEYSTDNGSTWLSIVQLTPAGPGSYAWLVPSTATTQGLVRASSANVPSIFDDSDQNFIIPLEVAQKYNGGGFDGFTMGTNQPPSLTLTAPNGGEIWAQGSTQNIQWNQTAVNSLQIEYSTNNGSTWSVITTNANAVTGSYPWTIPADFSTQVLVKVEDAFNPLIADTSDAIFTIPFEIAQKYHGGQGRGDIQAINANANLVLTYPVQPENFPGNSQVQITWNANTVASVNIDYSTNNGSNWLSIITNTAANTGVFTWNVPGITTTQGRVRISDVQNPSVIFDISAQPFTITTPIADKYFGGIYDGHSMNQNQPPSITVLAPNGAESWFAGDVQNITWSSVNVINVAISYSSNNGSNWNQIIASHPSALGTYAWSIPNIQSTQMLIRVEDDLNPLVSDVSDAVFTIPVNYVSKYHGGNGDGYASDINSANAIVVTTPNGGESLADGSLYSIEWSANNILQVSIELSTNNGSNWQVLAATVPGSLGFFNWTVPSINTSQALIRVADVQFPGQNNDVSNAVFSITAPIADKFFGGAFDGHASSVNQPPAVTVLYPNGGETLYAGDVTQITWTSVNVSDVDIDFSSNNGSTWSTIVSAYPAALGSVAWNLPIQLTGNVLVRITDTGNSLVRDTSDASFFVPFAFASKYLGGAGDGYASDVNAGNAIMLITPNGGESLADGSQYSITWVANNIGNVTLEFSSNNGSNWQSIIVSTPANTGNFMWSVPGVNTTTGRIRVSDIVNPLLYNDISDQVFTINAPIADKFFGGSYDGHAFAVNQPPTITVLAPNGGEVLYASDLTTITWSSVNVSTVRLDYSTNNGSSWNLITNQVPASLGNYLWSIPAGISGISLVRIQDDSNALVSDISDASFTIPLEILNKYRGGAGDGYAQNVNSANAIFLISPNGGEALADGGLFPIQWVSNNIGDVTIEYSTDNGSNWNAIIVSTPATLGSYSWLVPAVNTNQARVRVSDLVNPNQFNDASDQVFSITAPIADKYFGGAYDGHASAFNQPPSVTVISPNGGDTLYAGNIITINWASSDVTSVDLEFSTNNGSSWNLIAAQQPAPPGSYVWNMPIGISGLSLIRITDSSNPLVRDTSNSTFLIPIESAAKFAGGAGDGHAQDLNAANTVSLITPNGGEALADGQLFSIQWVANNLGNITLEFSTNNGSNWSPIIVSTPANVGSYLWTVPAVSTNSARVRISDLVNPLLYNDVSDQVFSITAPIADKFFGGSYDGHASAFNQPPAITLNYPNGGDTIYPGDVISITWTSSDVSNVDIEYSTNNGSSWIMAGVQQPATLGSYPWNVPLNINTNFALIRITDSGIPLVRDTSNATFVIPVQLANKYRGGIGDGYALDINAANSIALITPNGGESLAEAGQFNIQWVANGLIDVTLEYSTNNGSNWTPIVVSTPANTGNYLWTVPGINTNLARVRISDLVNPNAYNDISDQPFSISAPIADKYFGGSYDGHASALNIQASVTVTFPNGGETIFAGNNINVTWTSVDVADVDIEYSLNNGSSWTTVATLQPSSFGSYLWTVPTGISGNGLIRIKDSGDTLIRDVSNATFFIPVELTNKFRGGNGDGHAFDINNATALQLISPNGGEGIPDGTLFDIRWVANGINNLILEFSTNNGSAWQTIAISTPGNTGFYSWSVPGVNTTQARVRVSDITNPGIFFDVSDQVFSIIAPNQDKYRGGSYDGATMNVNQPPVITLISPDGGEVFYPGNQHPISWTSLNVGSVDIDYSSNNGSSWNSIAVLQPASLGVYYWNVPQINTLQALVRLRDSGNPLVADSSAAVFTIPFDLANKYRGGAGDGYAMNINAANALQLLSPNGGESLADGSQFSIQWIANNIQDVMLEYTTNNGSIWQAVFPVVPANLGTYMWSVPGVTTTLARVRVSDLIDPNTYFDISDSVFTIIGPVPDKFFGGSYDGHVVGENQPPVIAVVTPNGGEVLYPDFQYEITWTSANISNVGIEYSVNNGSTWTNIVNAYPAGAGSYFWTVPYQASDSVLIRVYDQLNPILSDASDAVFTIPAVTADKYRGGSFDGHAFDINATNIIAVVSPNGGENLPGGVNFTIEYAVNGIQNVSLDFSSDNGSSWTPVSISTQGNLGTFTWVTPLISTLQGRIRVADITNPGTIFDVSDAAFTITSPVVDKYYGGAFDGHAMNENQLPFVTVLSPNGSEHVYAGDIYPITWSSVNLNAVDIEFSVDNGSSWLTIDNQVPATQGIYNWNVPLVYGNHVFVRIQEHGNSLIADTSDAFFIIPFQAAQKYAGGAGSGHDMDINVDRILMVVAPNGGEVYASGSSQVIQWAGNTIQNVNIELSTNSGSSWSVLALNVPANLEAFNWQVGLNNTSTALIRVSDAVFTSTRRDTSDAVFAILAPDTSKYFGGSFDGHAVNENQLPSITLITPNGGEIWNSQTTQLITWSQVNISNVDLEYSIDNGSTWILIQSQLPVGGGSYNWLIPNNGTPFSLVRIKDSSDPLVRDSSNAVFTIPNLVSAKYNGGGFDGGAIDENTPPTLTLVTPNGGEVWFAGSQQNIQWSASNLSIVSLDYSTDNGSSWNVITGSVPANSGNFTWTLPNVASNAALVRVTDAVGGILNDISDAVFTIPHLTASKFNGGAFDGHGSGVNAANLIVLTEPNGGEIYPVMSPQNILWAANSIQAVNVEYSVDNGSTWFTVVSNIGGQFTQLNWTAPGPATSQALVRISQSGNPNVNVVSAATFMTVDPIADKYRGGAFDGHAVNSNDQPLLTLLTPNGGERWFVGSRQNITWSQVNVSLVDLEVSNDNGSNWASIVTQQPAQAGTYNWLVTGPGSDQSVVRIKSSADSLVRDSSNLVFDIPFQQDGKYTGGGFDGHAMSQNVPPAITVISPNGGETIYPLNSVAITWSSTNVSNVGIEYSTDAGSTWITVISAVSAQSGTYPWTVPSTGTSTALVRVYDVSAPTTVNDVSNATFNIPALVDNKYNGGGFDGAALGFNLTTATIAGADTLCSGDSVLLTFTLTGSTPWDITFTDGTTPVSISGISSSPYQALVPVVGTRTYTIQSVTSSSGSGVGIGFATAFVYPLPGVGFPPDPSICLGQSVPLTIGLTGTAPWSFTWTDGTNVNAVTGLTSQPYSVNVSPQQTTSYTISNVSDLNCSSSASFATQVNVLPLPDATITGADTVCPGTSVPLQIQFTGTSPFSFTYTDGVSPIMVSGITGNPYIFNVSPLSSTTYTLTGVSDLNCSAVPSSSVAVQIEPVPTAFISGSNTICIGDNAPLQIALSGTSPWDFAWTDGSAQIQVTGVTASPYTFNVSPVSNRTYSLVSVQNSYCSGTINGIAEVNVLSLPTAVLTGNQTVCQSTQAVLTATLTGTSPWSITWTDGTASTVVSGITSQPYALHVTPTALTSYTITNVSDAGCQQTVNTQAVINTFALPVASISGNQTICTGLPVAHTVTLSGTAPWDLTWTDGNTPTTISGITASPYVVMATPAQNTTYQLVSITDANCAGSLSGASEVILDAVPTASIGANQTICLGCTTTLQVQLTGSGPWDISWTDGTTPVLVTGINASPYTFSTTPTVDVTYALVSVQGNYCAGTVSGNAQVTVVAFPTAIISGSQTVCEGTTAQLTVTLSGLSPWMLTWSDGSTPVNVSGITASPYVFTVTPTQNAEYRVTYIEDVFMTSGQMFDSAFVQVDSLPLPPYILPALNIACSQATLQWNVADYALSYRFDLASDSLFTNIISGYNQVNTGLDTFVSLSGLSQNTRYYWRVRGVNPCGNGAYSLVGQLNTADLASLVSATSNAPLCNGSTLQLSGSSAYPGTAFAWSGPGGYSASGAIANRSNMGPSQVGAYTLTASASGCNSAQQVVQVAVNDSISNLAFGGNTALCAGETLTLTATASGTGIVYNWSGPGGFTAVGNPGILSSISNVNAGVFTLIAVSPGCNQLEDTLHVQVIPSIPVVVSNSGPHCSGDPVYFSASFVPVPYLWTGPNGFSSNLQNPSISNSTPLRSGIYSLQITQNGCSTQVFTTQLQVGSRTNAMALGSNTPVCQGQSLVLTSTLYPDVQYAWAGPNGFTASGHSVTIPNVTTAATGQYTVTASSVGCPTTVKSTGVIVYSSLSASGTINSPVCQGGALYLQGENYSSATYLWQGPNGFSSASRQVSINNVSPLNSGLYTLTVSQQACGSSVISIPVQVGGTVQVSPLGNNSPVCTGGTLNITAPSVQNGSVTWFGPAGFTSNSNTFSIPNMQLAQAGEYTVISTSPGCGTLTNTTTVLVNQSPVLAVNTNSPVCEGGVLDLSVISVPGATYSWSGPNGFQTTGNNAAIIQSTSSNTGVYTLVVGQPGCGTTSTSVSVHVGSNIVGIAPTSNSPACLNGSLQLSAESRPNVDYLWQGPDGFTSNLSSVTRTNMTALQAGLYTLSVNSNGCGQAVSSIQVIMNNPSQVTASNNTPICGGGNFTMTGTGNRSSSFVWTGPNAFSAIGATVSINNADPSLSGVYTLSVTDPGCGVITATTSVVVGANLNATQAVNNSPVCVGSNIQLSATLLPGSTYLWTGPNGFTSNIHNPLITNAGFSNAGNYSVVITSLGCIPVTRTTTVFVNPPVTSVSSNSSPVCQGSVVYFSGNFIPNVTYSWTGPNGFTSNQRNPALINAQPISSGTYTLTVSTPGCTPAVSTTVVSVGPSLNGITIGSNAPVCVGNNLLLSTTVNSGYSYSWTGPNGFTSTLAHPQINGVGTAQAGTYVVNITSVGCGSTSRSHTVAVQNIPGVTPGSNSPVCQGGVIYLTANGISGVTYNWTGPNGFNSSVRSPGISNSQLVNAGEYTLSVTNQACGTQTLTTSVVVGSSLSGVNILANNPLCVGQDLMLTATDRPGYTFLWSGPNGFTSTLAQPVVQNVTTANTGAYSVQFTSPGCGIANRSVSIRVNDPTQVAASNSGPACVNGVVYFTGSAPAGSTYSWSGPAGFIANVQNPSRSRVQLSHAGDYTLTANVPGCGGITSITTVVINTCREQDHTDVKGDLSGEAIAADEQGQLEGKAIDDISVPDSYKFIAWPNPTNGDQVTLRWEGLTSADKDITVKIYDASGRAVFVKSVARKNVFDVNIEDSLEFPVRLAKGIYTIETVHDSRWQYVKLIVQ